MRCSASRSSGVNSAPKSSASKICRISISPSVPGIGFGARFTQITPEARQLIYRYVRNREPLFHDDL